MEAGLPALYCLHHADVKPPTMQLVVQKRTFRVVEPRPGMEWSLDVSVFRMRTRESLSKSFLDKVRAGGESADVPT